MYSTTSESTLEEIRPRLVKQARAGWNNRLLGWCEPSDLVQQVLLEAYRIVQEFPHKAPVALEGWLRTRLERRLLDLIRYSRRKKRDELRLRSIEPDTEEFPTQTPHGWVQGDPTPSTRVMIAEELQRLRDCLVSLPADQAVVLELHWLKGKSIADTAFEMGRTVPAVAGLLRRGLERLRQLMDESR